MIHFGVIDITKNRNYLVFYGKAIDILDLTMNSKLTSTGPALIFNYFS